MSDVAAVELRWGVRVPLRDGIQLNATLYLPAGQSAPAPCVFTLTPYISDTYHDRGVYFAARGFPFAIVDVRGRGNSQGTFRPNLQEAKDGHDVVEWLAGQSFCSGKVAMWGGSYSGYNQWATAKECPPHLATIVPAAAPYMGVDFPMRNNIFNPYLMQWLTYTAGHASQAQIFADRAFWSGFYRTWHRSGRPFRDVDSLLGNPSTVFQEWLDHPQHDAYWDSHNPSADDYARMQLPVLTITGSYDDDQPGALEHHKEHMRNGTQAGRARHYLVIGPWDHAGTRSPRVEFGGMRFGAESLVDLQKLHVEWYTWTMLDGPKPKFLKKPVAYYVTGAERWRYADTLDEVTSRDQVYFLDSQSNANDVFSSGSLGPSQGQGQPDGYVYDPCEVDGPQVEAEARVDGGSLVDQSVTLALRGRVLVYHTAPFEANTEVSGFFKLIAWLSIDCPDTDIYVSVHEIGIDGTSVRLSTDAIRARYREGLREPKLIRTREPLRYEFDRFTFISRLVKRGHRLRLVVAPMGRLIETTFAEKNYNAGGVVSRESAADARAVTVRLFHDSTHPSALHVPLGRAESPGEPAAPSSSLLCAPTPPR